MPYIEVWVDAADIDDYTDEELRDELDKRKAKKAGQQVNFGPDHRIPEKEAKHTLEQASDIFRRDGRYDIAFRLEEIKHDFVIN